MANSKRFVVKNGLETQNIQFVEADGTESIILTVLDDGSISFSGSSGQLFSIVDSLTGSIFSVNDISGIPSIEVFDDGKVILAETTGNVGIGVLTPTEKLDVNGIVKATRLTSTIATGTAPLTVASSTVVANLNADLVDGVDSSRIIFGDNVTKSVTISNLNTPLASGFYDSNSGTGNPTATWYSVLNVRHTNSANNYGFQFAGDFFNSNNIFYRSLQGSNPTAVTWNKIWHEGNDGAGSTLDADLLDGNHASAFALDNAVVKLTGDQTVAGNKTFSNNVTITGDLLINGTTTNINTTNLVVEDKNIILGDVNTPTDTTADGGGITLKGATDKTITWVDSTDSWTFNQTIRHEGLNPSTGTNVDQLKSTTFTSALTTAWTDVTGVSGTYLATGSYIVQIESNGEYYTGDMSWFSGSTTSTVADEIELHRAGPAASAGRIYARVVRVSGSTLKLQVSASTTLSSHTMTFKFRRTI